MYTTIDDVRLAVTVPSTTVSDLAIQKYIYWAEREADRETFTTYWQLQTSGTASSATSITLTNSSAAWTENQFENCIVKLTGGTGSGQLRSILSGNSPTQITVDRAWTVTPSNDTTYEIYYSGTSPYFSKSVDGSGEKWYFVQNYPIRVVESLVINSTTVTPSNVAVYDDIGKLQLDSDCEYGYFESKQPQLVALAYWWGVNGVPREIERWVTLHASMQCLNMLLAASYNSPISYNLPEGSVALKPPTDAIRGILEKYKDEMTELSTRLIRYSL
jgi:hypothetical protein